MKTDQTINRRDFVRTSAAFAAAGFALPAIARGVHASHTDSLRVGLVGCGGRGTGAALQALSADENCRLTAMADAFIDRIDASLDRLSRNEDAASRIVVDAESKFTGFDGYKHLIDSVDVVLLATPPVFRPMHLAYAVEQGKHVFCEKPVAVDAPGVRSVLESARRARENNLALVSGFCWRYSTAQRETYGRILDGAIGEIRSIQSTYNTGPLADTPRRPGWSDMEWHLRNWQAFIWTSGDHIVEQAVHAVDWINWAMNNTPPVRAFAVGGRIARGGEWTGDMYDHFGVTYEYESGARAYHTCRQIPNCSNDNTAYLTGSKGVCYSNPWTPARSYIHGDEEWRFRGRNNDMYQQEHDELFASIRAGEPINDGEWMAQSTLMGILGREAAYTGQTLTWEQIQNSTKSYTPETWEWGDIPFPQTPIPGRTRFE